MEIWWGAPPPRLMCEQRDTEVECDNISVPWWWRAVKLAPTLVGVGSEADPITIPYFPTVNPEILVESKMSDSMKNSMKQAIVFYGADFTNAGDHYLSGVYGSKQGSQIDRRVPGVYFHAMALDNLITLNGRYIASQGTGLTRRETQIVRLAVPLGIGLLLLVAMQAFIWYPEQPSDKRHSGLRWGHYVFLTVILTGYALVAFFWWLWPPDQLLAFILVPTTAAGYDTWIRARVSGILSKMAGGHSHTPPATRRT